MNWTWIGDLDCPECDKQTQPCSDFFPVTCTSADCANPPSGNRWIFGVNGGGGAITGTFDRKTLKLTPDRPNAQTTSYGYGSGAYPKTYVSDDGRRIFYRWINGPSHPDCSKDPETPQGNSSCTWWGMQSVPTVLSPAEPDDVTNTMLGNPVEELAALRVEPPLAKVTGQALGEGGFAVAGLNNARHYDAVVTFHGLKALTDEQLGQLSLQVHVFAPQTGASAAIQSWSGAAALELAAPTAAFGNNTDIQSADLPGAGVRLPPNTTDEEGVKACTAACLKLSTCAAWVYCTERFQGDDRPRCALKGKDFCPPIPHLNTITGVKPGQSSAARNCSAPHPGPHPGPHPRPPLPAGWIAGQINGGPLALRSSQDSLEVRVLVDGSVVEAYWDGGRARVTSRTYPPARAAQDLGLKVSASSGAGDVAVTADIEVFKMASAWLDPIE